VIIDIQPESLNLDANGTITVFVYGTSSFDVTVISIGTFQSLVPTLGKALFSTPTKTAASTFNSSSAARIRSSTESMRIC
jgi:hypothetical protein